MKTVTHRTVLANPDRVETTGFMLPFGSTHEFGYGGSFLKLLFEAVVNEDLGLRLKYSQFLEVSLDVCYPLEKVSCMSLDDLIRPLVDLLVDELLKVFHQ